MDAIVLARALIAVLIGRGVISRGEKLNGVVPSKGRPYVEENGTMAVARPPEMESVKLTKGMDRERGASRQNGGGNGRGKQGRGRRAREGSMIDVPKLRASARRAK